jgi:hypothetical protein
MLEELMKRLRQARRMTTSALMIGALCAHLLIAGLRAGGPSPEPVASSATRVARVTTPQPRDAVATRSHNATLSLSNNARRTDSFAAALISPPARPTFAQTQARTVQPPRANESTRRLPAASRAPPSLVA